MRAGPCRRLRTNSAGWSIDEPVALRWGEIAARAERSGRPGSFADGLMAATALDRGLTLVTRNVTDFETFGVSLLDPWTAT